MKTVCEMLSGLFKCPESFLLIYDRVYALNVLKGGNTSTHYTRRSKSFLVTAANNPRKSSNVGDRSAGTCNQKC